MNYLIMRSKVKSTLVQVLNLHTFGFFLLILTSVLSFGASPGARKSLGNPKEFDVSHHFPLDQSVRSLGWELGTAFFSPHSLSYLSNFSQPQVPEFLTWFPINEVIRLMNQGFPVLNIGHAELEKKLDPSTLQNLFLWNTNLVGKLPSWSESRFLIWEKQFTKTEHLHSLNDLSRVLLNPKAVEHILNQSIYANDCLRNQDSFFDVLPVTDSTNHSPCFSEEFPKGSVIAKLNWTSLDEFQFKAYRTHPEELMNLIGNDQADWNDLSSVVDPPTGKDAIVAQLPTGKRFALTGIHFMVKNQADWTWITFWWSPEGYSSFKQDRPETFEYGNYSQCTVVADRMKTPANKEDLKQWIGVLSENQSERETWCSNPYLEHGEGNVGTNCIGCHQYAGSSTSEEMVLRNSQRKIIRNNFPSDYVWSFSNGPQAWSRQFIIRLRPHHVRSKELLKHR